MGSFKDNYAELTVKQTATNESSADSVVVTPTVEPVEVEQVEVEEVKIGETEVPIYEKVVAPQEIRVELTEEISEILTEQREQSAKVLESVMKTNTKIANSVTKLVKGTTETNEQLVEAIAALTEKIGMLEAKLEAIENLEIPTPIVHVSPTQARVIKEVHRDSKGVISHITETPVEDDREE